MAKKIQRKFDKHWGDCNMLISIAVVLDPRNKMTLIDFTFCVIYFEEDALFEISIVHDSLYELYKEYEEDHKQLMATIVANTRESFVLVLRHQVVNVATLTVLTLSVLSLIFCAFHHFFLLIPSLENSYTT